MCAAGHEGTWEAGAGACVACKAGTVKPSVGNGGCMNCTAGQGSASPFTNCTDCAADEYSAYAGDPCSPCNTPSETTDGATGQTECGKKINSCVQKLRKVESHSLFILPDLHM